MGNAMSKSRKNLRILMADDDEDDRFMANEAMDEMDIAGAMDFVENGEELMEYLLKRGKFACREELLHPDIILLDLNMPRKDGREALKEIKSDPALRHIPVVVLTTSRAEEDIAYTYKMGANSYITKPDSFEGLVSVMKSLSAYWFDLVSLPER